MKEYNPRIEDEYTLDCPCLDGPAFWCTPMGFSCPDSDTGRIPTDCPARGDGILIQVKE